MGNNLPPLTPAELAVLEPRYRGDIIPPKAPKAPVRASRPDDPSHTCGDRSYPPCPACVAAEIEELVESATKRSA